MSTCWLLRARPLSLPSFCRSRGLLVLSDSTLAVHGPADDARRNSFQNETPDNDQHSYSTTASSFRHGVNIGRKYSPKPRPTAAWCPIAAGVWPLRAPSMFERVWHG